MLWVTCGLLVSMGIHDDIYKRHNSEKDPDIKSQFSVLYKRYCNMIVSLLRKSKANYYSSYFLQNQSSVKKTWDGIRNLIKRLKKEELFTDKINL